MHDRHALPDTNRLSVLSATILLAYALTRYVNIPTHEIAFQVPGVYLLFAINFRTIVSVLVAALAATGMNWLLSDHPRLVSKNQTGEKITTENIQHWLLPSLTAWIIGVPLGNLTSGSQWWIVFGMGGVLLISVIIAEYIAVDASDIRHPPAVVGLTALSFALYLILAIAVRSAGLRLYLLLPALIPTAGLVALRTLYLRLGGQWAFAWAIGITVVVSQIAIALHYLPLSPIRFGLFLVAPLYALTSLAGTLEEEKGSLGSLLEPALMFGVLVGLAVWVG